MEILYRSHGDSLQIPWRFSTDPMEILYRSYMGFNVEKTNVYRQTQFVKVAWVDVFVWFFFEDF